MPAATVALRTVLQPSLVARSAQDSGAAGDASALALALARAELGALAEGTGACSAVVTGDDGAQPGGAGVAIVLFAKVGVQAGGG